jgi:hypothetical protein
MPALGFRAGRFGHFDLQREGALFVRVQPADTDHLAGDLLATLVPDGQHH